MIGRLSSPRPPFPQFHQTVKWHHFAFATDAARLAELRTAARALMHGWDVAPLCDFIARHAPAHDARLRAARADHVPRAERDQTLAAARALVPGATSRLDGELGRLEWEALLGRLTSLRQLIAFRAPAEVIASAEAQLREALAGVPPPRRAGPVTPAEREDALHDPQGLIAAAVELCVPPFAPNLGLGPGTSATGFPSRYFDDGPNPWEPPELELPHLLVSREVAVHHEAVDRLGGAFGGGDEVAVVTFGTGAELRDCADSFERDVTGPARHCEPEEQDMLRAAIPRWISHLRGAARTGGTLLSFIGKNPAL